MIPSLSDFPSLLRPMTQEESEIFIRTMLAEENRAEVLNLAHPERNFPGLGEVPFGLGVFCKRLEVCAPATEVTPPAAMFMVFLCKNPAMAVMWAYTTHRAFQRRGRFTMGAFADLFPFGIPTEDGYREAWKAQKRVDNTPGFPRSDNLLDAREAWDEAPAPEAKPETPAQDQPAEPQSGARKFDLSS